MAAVSRPLNGRMAEPGPIRASAHKDDRKALAKIAAGQGVGTVQSRGSMRLAAHRLGARALRAPGGRVAALEWSQMASARRAAGRPVVRGRGPQRLRKVCHALPWCTFLCMDCAGGAAGAGDAVSARRVAGSGVPLIVQPQSERVVSAGTSARKNSWPLCLHARGLHTQTHAHASRCVTVEHASTGICVHHARVSWISKQPGVICPS